MSQSKNYVPLAAAVVPDNSSIVGPVVGAVSGIAVIGLLIVGGVSFYVIGRRTPKAIISEPTTISNPFNISKEKPDQGTMYVGDEPVVFNPTPARKERSLTMPQPTIEMLRMSQRFSSRDLLPAPPAPPPFIINNKNRDTTKFTSGRNMFTPLPVRTDESQRPLSIPSMEYLPPPPPPPST